MKILLQLLALLFNALPKTDKVLFHWCQFYGRYGLQSPNLVGMNNPPTVSTGTAGSLANTTFSMVDNSITNTGGANATERGVVYMIGTSGDPTIANTKNSETGSFGTGNFTRNLTGLSQNTSYRVRAFATNSEGTGYGSTITVVTQGVPTVTTQAVSDITTTTATGNGNVTNGGGVTVTERGVVINTTGTPTVSDTKFQAGTGGTGAFTASMTSLTLGQHYYARAYAINSYGTVYGSQVEFDTLTGNENAIDLPDGNSTKYGRISNFGSLNGLTSYTVEGWFYQYDAAGRAGVFMLGRGTGTDYVSYLEEEADRTGINFGHKYSSTSADGYQSTGVFVANTWVHIAAVFVQGQATRIYKNGTEISYTAQNSPSGTYESTTDADVYLGRWLDGFSAIRVYFQGRLACFRMWNVARSRSDIADNKDYYLNPAEETGLIVNCNFTEGSGTTVDNNASEGNDMSLFGSPSWVVGPTLTEKSYESGTEVNSERDIEILPIATSNNNRSFELTGNESLDNARNFEILTQGYNINDRSIETAGIDVDYSVRSIELEGALGGNSTRNIEIHSIASIVNNRNIETTGEDAGYAERVIEIEVEAVSNNSRSFEVATEELTLNAIQLNGVDQWGLLDNYDEMEVGGTGTIEGWVYLADASRDEYGVSHSLITPGSNWASYIAEDVNSRGINFNRRYSTTSADGYTSTAYFAADTWVHVALVFTNGQVSKVFINGSEITYNLQNTPSGTLTSTDGMQLAVGRFEGTGANRWKGGIACSRLWNVARTQADIAANMNYYLDPAEEEGLVANLNFKEGEGAVVDNDASPGNDMTLSGSPTWIEGPELTDKDYTPPTPKPKIMPLGDSITEGWPDTSQFGYRDHLQDHLGVGEYDFVGPLAHPTSHATYDVQHAGYGGERTDELEARLDDLLDTYMTDSLAGSMVLLHAGTNDASQDYSGGASAWVANVEDMIDMIDAHDPDIAVYVALIIPSKNGAINSRIESFNSALQTMLETYQGAKSNLYIVDMYGAFTSNPSWGDDYMDDDLHPNATGYELMADTWFASLSLQEASGSRDIEVMGEATVGSSRDIEMRGQDSDNNARAFEIRSQAVSDSSRAIEASGIDTNNSNRSVELEGVTGSNNSRSIELSGEDIMDNSRSIEATGEDYINDVREVQLEGVAGSSSNRSIELYGLDTDDSSRTFEVEGQEGHNSICEFEILTISTQNNNRGVELTGQDSSSDVRVIELLSRDMTDASRSVEVLGQEDDYNEKLIELIGIDTTSASRTFTVDGMDDANASTREIELHGIDTLQATRFIELTGHIVINDYIDFIISGIDRIDSDRNIEIYGIDSDVSSRVIDIAGTATNDSDRSFEVVGQLDITSNRNLEIYAADTGLSFCAFELTGNLEDSSNRDFELSSQATVNSSCGFEVVSGTSTKVILIT